MKRPLLVVTLPCVAGILTASYLPGSPWLLLAGSLSLAGVILVWARVRSLLLYPLVFLLAWTNYALHTAILSPHDLRNVLGEEPALVTVRGTLVETPTLRVHEPDEEDSWRTMARVDVSGLRPNREGWRPAKGLIAVTTPGMLTNWFAGETVEVFGVAARPRVAVAEGTFDYRAYLRQQGIYYALKAASEQDWRVVSAPSAPPLADWFRAWARRALALGLPGEDESLRLEWALTLGWKTALTEEVSEPFIRAATYHIFAVDGLRMAIIFGIFFALFRALGLPRGWCGVVLLPLIWFYVALTGWPASAIRATVMLTVIVVGWALKRPSDLINSLFAAALIILVWQPQQLFQAGFQLSFLVVLCLILMVPSLDKLMQRLLAPDPLLPEALRRGWPPWVRTPARYLGDLLLTSFAAWIGSIPLVAYYFNIVTPVSTPANLLAVPFCALVLMSNLASLLLAAWVPAAAELFNHAGWFLMECIRVSSHWFAAWPAAYGYVPAPSLFTIGLYYVVLLGILTGGLLRAERRVWKLAALVLAGGIWCGLAWQERCVTRLSILPVNGGVAVYLDGPGVKNDVLMDCGTTNSVQMVTKPFLRAAGVNRLATFVMTHGDVRHIGGAEVIPDLFSVRQVVTSGVRFRSPAYRRAVARFSQQPELLLTVGREDRVGPWRVLHPAPGDRFSQADDNALVLAGCFDGTRILLLSDLGRAGQRALLARTNELGADIVVTGLPSQGEALGEELLDAIHPGVIIVADSEFPVSERAGGRLRERLEGRRVPVIYTRSAGATTIEFRGKVREIRTMSGVKMQTRTAGN